MKKGFDNVAVFYDALSFLVFGKSIRKAKTCYLSRLKNSKSILIIGGGTGWWLNELRRINPNAEIIFIDASAKMIAKARQNGGQDHKITFIHGTHESLPPGKTFDAIVLFFFLDLFDNNAAPLIVERLRERLSKDAIWLVSDFVNQRTWHQLFLKVMYTFFAATAGVKNDILPDWQRVLRDAPLRCVEKQSFYGQFIWASVWH